MYVQKVEPLQVHDLHDYCQALWLRVIAPPKVIVTLDHIIINGTEWNTKACCQEGSYSFISTMMETQLSFLHIVIK